MTNNEHEYFEQPSTIRVHRDPNRPIMFPKEVLRDEGMSAQAVYVYLVFLSFGDGVNDVDIDDDDWQKACKCSEAVFKKAVQEIAECGYISIS